MDQATKQARAALANRAIEIIAGYGRKFFSLHADDRVGGPERISRFELRDDGRLWFIDKYTQKAIDVACRRERWDGFSEGGTLRDLVFAMADWITGKRKDSPVNALGPWPDYVCGGDPWGYGVDMATVREQIRELSRHLRWLTE